MSTVPDKNNDAIQFYEQRIGSWTLSATQIGLTAAEVSAFTPIVTAARSSFGAAQTARQAAKNATVTLNAGMTSMRDQGAGLIAKVRAFAEATGNPNVYVLASIPPPADPSPAPDPTPPSQVSGSVNNDGNVVLRWKATRVNGDFFSVWRKVSGGEWTAIASVATKTYTDVQLPAGNSWAQYQVKSHRGAEVSEGSEPVVILFGKELAA